MSDATTETQPYTPSPMAELRARSELIRRARRANITWTREHGFGVGNGR